MMSIDKAYVGLPWKIGGRDRTGIDCVGITWLWLADQFGLSAPTPCSDKQTTAEKCLSALAGLPRVELDALKRGDVVFFKHCKQGPVVHVAPYLGDGKILNMMRTGSRIENGFTLLNRIGLEPVAAVSHSDAGRLCLALSNPELGDPTTAMIVELAVSIALLAVSAVISSSSTNSAASAATTATVVSGKYRANSGGLATAKTAEIPLPDILGSVVVAGNCIYQQLSVKELASTNSPPQAWNQIIVLNSGPSDFLDFTSLRINGLSYQDKTFHSGNNMSGFGLNPGSSDAAVNGHIGGDTYVPSVTFYHGSWVQNVPTDPRAQGDRGFPVYGLAGTSYLVFRLFDSSVFSSFNITIRVQGRRCRTYDSSGFIRTTITNESLTGANGTKARFKMSRADVVSVSAVSVNGTSYAEIAPGANTGHVYYLNKTKGFIEFLTAPANGATILVSFVYYPRTFSTNPATHVAYLLTEPRRGKGFQEDKIDWPALVAARDYYDETVTWMDTTGASSSKRYQTNYSIDTKKAIQDHLQVLLDACHSVLLLMSGKFVLFPIRTGDSVFSFDTSNMILDDSGESTFKATLSDRSGKANRVKLSYYSEDTLNSQTDVIADDESNQAERAGRAGDEGVVESDLTMYAVTNYAQAARLAETTVRENVKCNWLWSWTTNIQGIALMPGDIVDVSHPSLGTLGSKQMRITALEVDANDHLSITAMEYVPSAYF